MTKRCTACGQVKALEEFSPSKLGRHGRESRCKPCKVIASRTYNQEHPQQHAARCRESYHRGGYARRLHRLFGDDGDYDRLLKAAGGRCEACAALPSRGRRLAVDHDHTTGRVRGLWPCQPEWDPL